MAVNAVTNIVICNMALGYIAKTRIFSLEDKSEEARMCSLYYDHLRRMLLRNYTWGFAKRVVQLALISKTMPGYEYVYAYPSECLAVRNIYNKDGASVKEYEREKYDIFVMDNGVVAIACDVEDAFIEYTHDVVDADTFSVDFVEALSRLIASNIAQSLTGSAAQAQEQYQLFQAMIANAKLASAQERQNTPHFPDDYLTVRM
ncbi:MAG: hypothetical protein IJZ69_04265 [Bacteroidales bacterium]|nr:hypothetical protein [Bacteroidales bacterium]MBQ8809528.1 hypothetical protein [Bacteroidales bacterium]